MMLTGEVLQRILIILAEVVYKQNGRAGSKYSGSHGYCKHST